VHVTHPRECVSYVIVKLFMSISLPFSPNVMLGGVVCGEVVWTGAVWERVSIERGPEA
jgi:hypothetical protein